MTETERAAITGYCLLLLADLYGPEEARQWLAAPNHFLDNKSPACLIRADRSDDVLCLIQSTT